MNLLKHELWDFVLFFVGEAIAVVADDVGGAVGSEHERLEYRMM